MLRSERLPQPISLCDHVLSKDYVRLFYFSNFSTRYYQKGMFGQFSPNFPICTVIKMVCTVIVFIEVSSMYGYLGMYGYCFFHNNPICTVIQVCTVIVFSQTVHYVRLFGYVLIFGTP